MEMKKRFKIQSILILAICFLYSCNNTSKQSNLNDKGSISELGDLKENPLLLGVITTQINSKDKTMSTLYGNKIAVDYAAKHIETNYPSGAVLYEVTWQQEPDAVWFGANIPANLISVEKVMFFNENKPSYTLYKSKYLKKSKNNNSYDRLNQITSQRFAATP
jgi:hypothetical protein